MCIGKTSRLWDCDHHAWNECETWIRACAYPVQLSAACNYSIMAANGLKHLGPKNWLRISVQPTRGLVSVPNAPQLKRPRIFERHHIQITQSGDAIHKLWIKPCIIWAVRLFLNPGQSRVLGAVQVECFDTTLPICLPKIENT